MKHQNQIKTSKNLTSVERESLVNNPSFKNGLYPKKWVRTLVLLCFFISTCNFIYGHGVVVNNVTINGQNTVQKFSLVNFDITWNNSWRNTTTTNNWDACWVFVKYRKKAELTWNHATLNYVDGTGSGDGHTAPTGSTINSTSDGKGIMIYSSSNIVPQTVNYNGAKLRWNYGTDGLTNLDSVEIRVFAIEMVYVPQGSFYVGDGTSTNIQGHFRQQPTNTPFQITSEGSITLGGTGAGSLNNNNASGMIYADDFNNTTSQTLPAAYPKGFDAFYCMKYEITQMQYVAFLNTLTRAQQNARTETSLASGVTSVTRRYVMYNQSTMYYRNGIRCDATIHTSDPITFYCDFNGNGTPNEVGDGQNIACNYLSWADLAAYLDWAALRPMTELEYEKAARGNQAAVANEYAWGSTSLTQTTGISNSGANNETASNTGANAAYGSHASVQGPLRVGNFGQGVNTRVGVGASYWGIMELSGNLWERTVTIGNTTGRAFTGTHGNGALNATGDADVSNWPATTSTGTGFRGGQWSLNANLLRVSDRYYANTGYNGRIYYYDSGRGIRVCPVP